MNPDLKQLYDELETLKQKIDNFYRSSSIDRNVQTALVERLGDNFPTVIGTSTAPTQSVAVNSTPTNITVPAQPSGSLQITYKGTIYYLLYR